MTHLPTITAGEGALATQLKLHALANAALKATASVDARGNVLHTPAGISLIHVIHDLIEVDAVYDKALDLEREFGPVSREGQGDRDHAADVRWAQAVRR